MNKERLRSLAAISIISIIAVGSAGCSAKPEFSAEAFQQVSAVTDHTLHIVRSASVERAPNDLRTDVRTLSDAVLSALRPIDSQLLNLDIGDRSDAIAVADVLACLSANAMLPDSEVMQRKLDEALRSGDQMQIIGRQQLLTDRSRRAVLCAMLATETLATLESADAIGLVGATIGPAYANAIAWQALNGLDLNGLMERHVAANALILRRLSPRCARRSGSAQRPVTTVPCVAYQLALQAMPKLQSALPSRPTSDANAVTTLTNITDTQIRLLDTGSEDVSTLRHAVESIADAVKAAQGQIQRHGTAVRIGNRADARVYAEMKACSDSHAVLFENVATLIRHFDELQVSNEAAATASKSAFGVLTVDASRCAIMVTTYMDGLADMDAVDKMGMLVGELYAISFATERLVGLDRDGLLAPQLDAYQTVVKRLASRCDPSRRSMLSALFGERHAACDSYRAATDALTKLSARKQSSRHSSPES